MRKQSKIAVSDSVNDKNSDKIHFNMKRIAKRNSNSNSTCNFFLCFDDNSNIIKETK